jgi:AbrB family looped-hinge helix DNA binding protein
VSAARVSGKGQLVIPAEIREKFGIEPGTRVRFVEEGPRLVLVLESLAAKLRMIDAARGITAGGPSMTDSLLEDRRLERDRELREEGWQASMIVYALDSSAVLRFADDEAGSERVGEILKGGVAGRAQIIISAVQWGEVAGRVRGHHRARKEIGILSALLSPEVEIVPASAEQAVRAADLKVDRKISYANAFALDLAMQSAEHVLVTADYGFKAVDDLAWIEYLPAKWLALLGSHTRNGCAPTCSTVRPELALLFSPLENHSSHRKSPEPYRPWDASKWTTGRDGERSGATRFGEA